MNSKNHVHKSSIFMKIIILGDSGVGKTSLINHYVKRKFSDKYKATIGTDFMTKHFVTNDGKNIAIQLWDTAGQERFQSLANAFYRGADCCILVYDVTQPGTFRNLDIWRDEFLRHGQPNNPNKFPFLIIGNKIDLNNNRMITTSQGIEWSRKNNKSSIFVETSVRDGYNIDQAFEKIISKMIEHQAEYESKLLNDAEIHNYDYFYFKKSSSKSNCSPTVNLNLKSSSSEKLNNFKENKICNYC